MKKMQGEDFNEMAPFFDQMAQMNWLSSVHDQLKLRTGDWRNHSVLDVGCGTGRLLLRGVKEAAHLTGVDLSPKMLEMSQRNFRHHNAESKSIFLEGDVYDLPLADDSFDIVLSTCVMFLLPEPEKGIMEMVRVTKRGGVIGMLNPTDQLYPDHAKAYCEKHGITGLDEEALLEWSKVSTTRHRYNQQQFSAILHDCGVGTTEHHEVLDGLALVTIGRV